jgi:hypothetical protein
MSKLEAEIKLIQYSNIKGIIYYKSVSLKQHSEIFVMVNLLKSTKSLLKKWILHHDNETTYAEL